MKKIILIVLSIIIFTSCSSKHPSVKTGAIIGGTTGAIVGGLFYGALSSTQPGSGHTLEGALLGGTVLGLIGAGLGAGTGYAVDIITQDDKKIQEIQESHALIEDK